MEEIFETRGEKGGKFHEFFASFVILNYKLVISIVSIILDNLKEI